jgi:succinate dehydrogenase / fumarate reductase cytochrome b subunit
MAAIARGAGHCDRQACCKRIGLVSKRWPLSNEGKPVIEARPLSPHLSIWRWRVHMAVSIFHRVSGHALAFAGLALFSWWLMAAATSREAYLDFMAAATSPLGWVVWVGLSWMFFQHLLSGLRHLVMDSGWGYGLRVSKLTATWVFIGAVALTALFWTLLLWREGGF